MRSFDPVRLGGYETDAWVAYYRRRWAAALVAFVGMVRVGFGMPWPRTLHGAWLVLRANQAWAPYPDNDPDAARSCMRRFYALVVATHHESFDVNEAARLEVEWWRIHRYLQRESADGDVAPLTDALCALYAHVYGVPAEAVRQAAGHRAEAMVISDKWVADGAQPGNPAIDAERAELVKAYAALRNAIRRSPTAP
jgi:hypothetical protein